MCDKYKWDSNQFDKEKGLITSKEKTIQMHNIYIIEFYLRWKQNTLFPKQYSL